MFENWKKSWFSEMTAPDGQTKPICIRYNLSQCTSQKCTFAHCCPVQCAAPQTTQRSRVLTDHAKSPPGDSSQRRKRRPTSEGRCPSHITEECKQRSSPTTDPTIPLDLPLGPTPPLSATVARAPAKYFLDICAGRSAPL